MLFTALLLSTSMAFGQNQSIMVSLAGTGTGGFSGDGGPGGLAQISAITDVLKDGLNNTYIADYGNNRIRMVSAQTGLISTVAGGGTSTADGIPATAASIAPFYMCMDAAGNLYFTTGNQIRVINTNTGIITTLAGTGVAGFSGDGGAATAAQLNFPGGICCDPIGNVYFVDGGGATLTSLGTPNSTRIRRIDGVTGIITTLAGTGVCGYTGDGGPSTAAQLCSSIAICIDPIGNIYFSDQQGSLSWGGAYIRKIDGTTGIITTIAGTGGYPAGGDGSLATAACLGNIFGMCCDVTGNVYCCDVSCSCRKIDMSTGIINTVGGSITVDGYNGDGMNSMSEELNWPHGMFIDNTNNILIADYYNYRVRRAINLTTQPIYAYGEGQTFATCSHDTTSIANQLAVVDIDSAINETWTVLVPPSQGALIGFPVTAMSRSVDTVTLPSSTFYVANSTYMGLDSFQVQVSNGISSDVVKVYVNVNCTGVIPTEVNNTLKVTESVNIYPNPASTEINVATTCFSNGKATIVLSDILGNEIYATTLLGNAGTTGTVQINIGSLTAGIYMIKVNNTEVRKFTKE